MNEFESQVQTYIKRAKGHLIDLFNREKDLPSQSELAQWIKDDQPTITDKQSIRVVNQLVADNQPTLQRIGYVKLEPLEAVAIADNKSYSYLG